MKIFNLPKEVKAFIFDIDSTLYTDEKYAFEQIDCQIRQFAKVRGISCDEARKMIADYRAKYENEHNGAKISLGNTLCAFGIPIETSVKWRSELLEPANYLCKDKKLIKTLEQLLKKAKLVCVTNNPILPARKTLDAIGVSDFFPVIIGLDTCLKSKPAYEPFEKAIEYLGVEAKNCVAIGDRYDMDIKIPLEMGMGGILVDGVVEVYQIYEKCYNSKI